MPNELFRRQFLKVSVGFIAGIGSTAFTKFNDRSNYGNTRISLNPIFYGGNGTTPVDSGLPYVGVIYGVAPNGDLLWYRYSGQGDSDRSGSLGWHPNSGNPIGNGW